MFILLLYCLSMSTTTTLLLLLFLIFSFYKKFGSKQIANSMLYCHETLISSVSIQCYCTVLFVNCNCSMFVQKKLYSTVKTSQVLSMSNVLSKKPSKNLQKKLLPTHKCLFVSFIQCFNVLYLF